MPWPEQRSVPASVVAYRTARAMQQGQHEIIPNIRGRLLVYLNRLAPIAPARSWRWPIKMPCVAARRR